MKQLAVAPETTLPAKILSDSIAVIGRKRSGKSNNAAVIVEEAFELPLQTIILDPKGDWWGITSSADGKHEGYPVVILGGKHATEGVALNPHAGTATARWVVETRYSVLIDLSLLEQPEIEAFLSDFLAELRRLKIETPGSILLVVDEADELAPEDQRERVHVLKTMSRLIWMVKRGGAFGIGTLFITQRVASLSKNILSQTEVLVVLQTTGTQDLDAVSDAVKHHIPGDTKKERAENLENLLREIVKLEKGQAVVVSGQMLKGILTIPFRRRKTFDSGATPELGKAIAVPKVVAKVALAQLSETMAAAAAEVKASDPSLLKKRVRELEEQLRREQVIHAQSLAKQEPKTVETTKYVLQDGQLLRAEKVLDRAVAIAGTFDTVADKMREAAKEIASSIALTRSGPAAGHSPSPTRPVAAPVRATAPRGSSQGAGVRLAPESPRAGPPASSRESRVTASGEAGLTSTHQAVLNAALFLETVGFRSPGVPQLALMSKLAPNSGYWRQIIGRLRSLGLMEGTSLTAAGRAQAVQEPLSGAQDVQARALAVLPSETHRKVLRVLLEAYPNAYTQDRLSELSGLAVSSGYGRQIIGRLRSLGVATKGWPIAAAPFLFLEEAA